MHCQNVPPNGTWHKECSYVWCMDHSAETSNAAGAPYMPYHALVLAVGSGCLVVGDLDALQPADSASHLLLT